jgi:hypothetical protein
VPWIPAFAGMTPRKRGASRMDVAGRHRQLLQNL